MKVFSRRAFRAAFAALGLSAGAALAQQVAVADGTPEIDSQIAQKNWSGAQTLLAERVRTHPQDVQARFKLATVLARTGQDDQAIAAFQGLISSYPELPEPYNNLAALYAKHGRYEEARATLENSIKANPGYQLGYENLGNLYLSLAASSYRRGNAIKANPTLVARALKVDAILHPPAPVTIRRTGAIDYQRSVGAANAASGASATGTTSATSATSSAGGANRSRSSGQANGAGMGPDTSSSTVAKDPE
jgi:tetratricopeptide (TPR) repeat protein